MEQDRLLRWVEGSVVGDFAPPVYEPAHAQTTLEAAGRSADAHASFLQRWNGCYLLGGALHLFGACPAPPNQSLDLWNRFDGWRRTFGPITNGSWYFAENAFGDQFGYREGKVIRMRALEARVEPVASNFNEWLETVLLDPPRWLQLDLFEACVRLHGALPFGGHFGPPPTWTQGSPLRADSMSVFPARDNLELRAASSIFSASNTRPGGFRPR